MKSITQNYEKILENLIIDNFSHIIRQNDNRNPGENKVFNYIRLLDTLDEKICEIAKKSLITVFETLDRGFKNSIERRHKYHIKAHTRRTIMTIFGEITYRKTIYQGKHNYKSYCFIDDYLGLKKYDYFDPYIKASILEYAANNPYSKVAKIVNDLIGNRIKIKEAYQYITRQTVRNIILSSNLSKPKYKELKTPDDLYIMADEKFVATQNNNKEDVMVKDIVVFDGRDEKNNQVKLKNKMSFSSFKGNECLNECLDYLYYVYDLDKIKNIYVMGDGAKWIKNLVNEFKVNENTNVSFNLDKFHFKQAIHHIGQDEFIEKCLTSYVLGDSKKDFIECCECLIESNPYREQTINEKKEYILNNWNYINNLYKNRLKCPMESQISHTLADLFTSRPKGYSLKNLTKLLKLRLLYKNYFNIKLLYLNNINKKDILIINQEYLNYQSFYTTHEPVDEALFPPNYYPGYYHDSSINFIPFF